METQLNRTQSRLRSWGGYQPYQYLSPNAQTPTFDFAAQVGRVPEASVTWSAATTERAARILDDVLVISAHDHLSLRPEDPSRFAEYRRSGREFTPYEGIAASGVDIFFDGGPAAVSMIRSHAPFDWDDAISDLAMRQADWAHQELVKPVRALADIHTLDRDSQVGVVLTLESATCIGNDIDRLDVLYGLGVRLLGVVYSESNQLGSGLADTNGGPLTRLGRRAVRRMNELGIVVDVSHASDATALDVVSHSDKPVVVTHAGARTVWPTPRMKPDNVIRATADSGGFIGIEAAPHTTEAAGHSRHTLEAVMQHVEYCLELVGPEHVAIGPDTNFGDHAAWHRTFAPLFGKDPADPETARVVGPTTEQHENVPFVRGCENPAESTTNMICWLVDHGYSDHEIGLLAGQNVLRVVSDVWS